MSIDIIRNYPSHNITGSNKDSNPILFQFLEKKKKSTNDLKHRIDNGFQGDLFFMLNKWTLLIIVSRLKLLMQTHLCTRLYVST